MHSAASVLVHLRRRWPDTHVRTSNLIIILKFIWDVVPWCWVQHAAHGLMFSDRQRMIRESRSRLSRCIMLYTHDLCYGNFAERLVYV
jgi:hypothetical protein